MIYEYFKYKDIDGFVKNVAAEKNPKEYTISHKCNGMDVESGNLNDFCFGCFFCIFYDPTIKENFINHWGKEFIKSYADKAFNGEIIPMPTAKRLMKNPIKSLEDFTAKDETQNIQPWAAGLLNHICSTANRIGMEVPVFNKEYSRNGRLDICSQTPEKLIVMESKISVEDALADERFVEQQKKYKVEIEKSTSNYVYLTLLGSKEGSLYFPGSTFCTGSIGDLSKRFYKLVTDNNIKFISANALWLLCCKYITYGNDYSWDNFLYPLFKDPNCMGLLSAGAIINSAAPEIKVIPGAITH